MLKRRAGRRVFTLLALLESARRGDPCVVRYDGRDWVQRCRTGTVVSPTRGYQLGRQWDVLARDVFLHHYTPRPGDVVVDVGAGIGTEVRMFSDLVGPRGRVVAIEAHPRVYSCLEKTISANHLRNVTPVQCAVTASPGDVLLEDDLELHESNGLARGDASSVVVTGRTLVDVMRSLGVERIDLLKMNIEGAELDALRGAVPVMPSIAHAAISCHDFKADRLGGSENDWMRTFKPVTELLGEQGFTVSMRPEDPRAFVRGYVYASRPLRTADVTAVATVAVPG